MNAVMQDYTLSASHFNISHLPSAEQFDKPPTIQGIRSPGVANRLVSGAYIFSERAVGYVSSTIAATSLLGSPREALELSLEIEKAGLLRHLHKNLFDPSVSSDVDAISETIDHTYEIIARWPPSALRIKEFIGSQNAEHLAAVLRVTSDLKAQLDGWNETLSYAVELMVRTDVDVHDALYGLI